jgi:tetratricopeptide (TPR) repeat protein
MPFQDDESPVAARGRAKSKEWLARDTAASGSADFRNRLTKEIEEFVAEHSDEEWVYAAAAFTHNWLGRNRAAIAVMRRYREKFPESTSLDRNVEFFYFNFGTIADLRSLPDRFRRMPGYWTSLLGRAKKAGEPEETLLEAARNGLELMTETTDGDGTSRADLAERLLREGLDARLAERAARSALTVGETMRPMDHLLLTLPKEVIEKSLRMMNYPIYRSSLGWALASQGRVPEALAELNRAAKLVEEKHLRTHYVFLRQRATAGAIWQARRGIQRSCDGDCHGRRRNGGAQSHRGTSRYGERRTNAARRARE